MAIYRTPPCPMCDKPSLMKLPPNLVQRWQNGELIQNVFPMLSIDDRELIKTGFHKECWDKLFNEVYE